MKTTPAIPVPTSLSELEMWLFQSHTSTPSNVSAYIDAEDGLRADASTNVAHFLPDPPRRCFRQSIVETVLLRAA